MRGFLLKQSYFFFMDCSSKSLAYANSVFDSQDLSEAFQTCYDSSSRSLAAVSGILISFSIVNFIGIITFYSKTNQAIYHITPSYAFDSSSNDKFTHVASETPKLETSYFSHFIPTYTFPHFFPPSFSFPFLPFQASKITNQHFTTIIVKIDMSAQK